MTRLDRWVAWVIAERPDPGQQQLLAPLRRWHVIRRLRGSYATMARSLAAQQSIKAPLPWLTGSPRKTSPWQSPGMVTRRRGCPALRQPAAREQASGGVLVIAASLHRAGCSSREARAIRKRCPDGCVVPRRDSHGAGSAREAQDQHKSNTTWA